MKLTNEKTKRILRLGIAATALFLGVAAMAQEGQKGARHSIRTERGENPGIQVVEQGKWERTLAKHGLKPEEIKWLFDQFDKVGSVYRQPDGTVYILESSGKYWIKDREFYNEKHGIGGNAKMEMLSQRPQVVNQLRG